MRKNGKQTRIMSITGRISMLSFCVLVCGLIVCGLVFLFAVFKINTNDFAASAKLISVGERLFVISFIAAAVSDLVFEKKQTD